MYNSSSDKYILYISCAKAKCAERHINKHRTPFVIFFIMLTDPFPAFPPYRYSMVKLPCCSSPLNEIRQGHNRSFQQILPHLDLYHRKILFTEISSFSPIYRQCSMIQINIIALTICIVRTIFKIKYCLSRLRVTRRQGIIVSIRLIYFASSFPLNQRISNLAIFRCQAILPPIFVFITRIDIINKFLGRRIKLN